MANRLIYGETKLHIGDTIKVHYKLIEKEKEAGKAKREVKEKIRERIQIFEGILIAIKGKQENKSFTVRKIASEAIGIERIFPVISPWIKKITVVSRAKVRRSKLYYLRERTGKKATYLKPLKKKIQQTNKPKSVKPVKKNNVDGQDKKPKVGKTG